MLFTKSILQDIIVGLLAAYVPINVVGGYLEKQRLCKKNGFSVFETIRTTPIFFAVLFPILMELLRRLISYRIRENLFIVAFIFALVISSIGRFVTKTPSKLLEMKTPWMFHVYAIVVWQIFFQTLARIVYSF